MLSKICIPLNDFQFIHVQFELFVGQFQGYCCLHSNFLAQISTVYGKQSHFGFGKHVFLFKLISKCENIVSGLVCLFEY